MFSVGGKGFLEDVAREAEKRGLKVELRESVLKAVNPDLPIGVEVKVGGNTAEIKLIAKDNLEEDIREYAEEEELSDVREAVEEILETAIAVVDYAVKAAERSGFKVVRKTRQTILDVYEAIDSYEESRE